MRLSHCVLLLLFLVEGILGYRIELRRASVQGRGYGISKANVQMLVAGRACCSSRLLYASASSDDGAADDEVIPRIIVGGGGGEKLDLDELFSQLGDARLENAPAGLRDEINQRISENAPSEMEMRMRMLGFTPWTVAGFLLSFVLIALNSILGTGWAGSMLGWDEQEQQMQSQALERQERSIRNNIFLGGGGEGGGMRFEGEGSSTRDKQAGARINTIYLDKPEYLLSPVDD